MNTIIGIAAGFICVVISILLNGSNIGGFLNWPSMFVVIGGCLCASFASFTPQQLKETFAAVKLSLKTSKVDLNDGIETIIKLANIARRDGLLALEEQSDQMPDPFLKKAIMLVVDGSDPELVQSLLETELDVTKERHANNRAVLDQMSAFAPAFGMIGTLIGLINMLLNLSDMSSLGPSMSVALVTTFYGSMLANLVFIPFSRKLKCLDNDESLQKELIIEGVLSIQNGENPRVIREKLNAFLSKKGIKEPKSGEGSAKEKKE